MSPPRRSPLHEEHAAAGARLVETDGWLVPADFGDTAAEYDALRGGAALLDLSLRGKLRVAGPDRTAFLHNMLSNDIRALRPGEGCNAAKLTVQGKMEAGLHVLCLEDELLCDVDPGPAARVREALDRHRIMEDARIEEVTGDWALIAIQGPGAEAALATAGVRTDDLGEPLRHALRPVCGIESRLARVDHCGEGGFDIWVPAARAARVWRGLRELGRVQPAGLAALDVRRIEAGIPWAGAEITGEYFPMEAGLDIGWISYTKGCYLGQETIARVRHLGHVNRHLRGLVLEGDDVPPRPSTVWSGSDRAGQVTSSTRSPQLGHAIALAYLHRQHAEPGTRLEVETDAGRRASRVVPLPLA
jgi:aminomethyltransferase